MSLINKLYYGRIKIFLCVFLDRSVSKSCKKKFGGNLKMTPTSYSSQPGANAKCEKVRGIVMQIFCCVEFSKCRNIGILRSQSGWQVWHNCLKIQS